MRRRGWRGRSWAIVWAVLQFALPALATSADAYVERDAGLQVAHVESTSASTCRPAHPAECALCQLATRDMVAAAHPAVPVPPALAARPLETERLAPATASSGYLPPARAPPLA